MGENGPLKEECSLGPKSKRRRTSPQDHAILEAAYRANSKPGKEERARIVSQVKLGEKEVQIWFQNRRQNDRRRSKPLQPHELLAHIIKTTSPTTLTPNPSQGETGGPIAESSASPSRGHVIPTPSPESQASQPESVTQDSVSEDCPSSPTAIAEEPLKASQGGPEISPLCDGSDEQLAHFRDVASKTPEPKSRPQAATPTSSGRKRSYQEMMQQTGLASALPPSEPGNDPPSKPKEPLKRSSSVRLAMTVDGAVRIRTTDSPTPSPEKERSVPAALSEESKQRRLSRSASMMDDVGGPKAMRPTGVFGRSRDHRKWEFYCDNSADKALSIQVEAERSGSAVGAINLIRSNSLKGRGLAMSPAPTRSNLRPNDPSKPSKPKISRAKSSLARLGSQSDHAMKGSSQTSQHVRSPSDSDKENWAPGTQMSENPLRRTQPSTNSRPILQDNGAMIFPDASAVRARTLPNKLSPRKEKARGEDLDCIQGLLSLSQGAWR